MVVLGKKKKPLMSYHCNVYHTNGTSQRTKRLLKELELYALGPLVKPFFGDSFNFFMFTVMYIF